MVQNVAWLWTVVQKLRSPDNHQKNRVEELVRWLRPRAAASLPGTQHTCTSPATLKNRQPPACDVCTSPIEESLADLVLEPRC
jgi:hypothetical protein